MVPGRLRKGHPIALASLCYCARVASRCWPPSVDWALLHVVVRRVTDEPGREQAPDVVSEEV